MIFNSKPPAAVIAQGDTTTVFAASVASFYRKIPFVHVEAGLRSHDIYTPFPEEFHRRAIATATSLHCAPTLSARENLLAEGVSDRDIIVSGNTVIDTLLKTAATNARRPADFPKGKTILVTAHRRENFGEPLKQAFVALRAFLDIYPDYSIYFPVHPNPNARDAARAILSDHPRVRLVDPLGYREMVGALEASWAIVTDSGGLQEEAPALGKPVLVLRDVTERPEAVKAGVVELVGTDRQRVFEALASLHNDAEKYARMARAVFPYGDGQASKRIVEALEGRLNVSAKLVANSNLPPMSRAK
jgi:UDP-N-acetylglucosamine 2-epimerase (non-hydrolysing)